MTPRPLPLDIDRIDPYGTDETWRCRICGKSYPSLPWVRRHRKSGCCARIASGTHIACAECSVSMRHLERGLNGRV